jgi:hypothetical protein
MCRVRRTEGRERERERERRSRAPRSHRPPLTFLLSPLTFLFSTLTLTLDFDKEAATKIKGNLGAIYAKWVNATTAASKGKASM